MENTSAQATSVVITAAGPWGGHQNGYIPEYELTPLSWDPSERLEANAAAAFESLNVAYRQRFGSSIAVTDSYRDYAAQVRVYAEKGPGLAATPGTSNHGWALAVDLGGGINSFGTAQHNWMQANAPAYGWIHPSWARPGGGREEPWHWEYAPGGSATTPPNPDPTTPAPTTPKERTMRVIQAIGDPRVYSTDGVRLTYLSTQGQVNDMLRIAGQTAVEIVGAETVARLTASEDELVTKVWARSIGTVDGAVRTVGQGVALAAAASPTAVADEVWARGIGTIAGKARTTGQGVALAAQAAVGGPVSV